MKSQEQSLLGLYASLLKDVEAYYPRDSIEWSRDMSRLRSMMETRGTKFFTIDLVSAGKHLDRCLSNRVFLPSKLPCQRARRGSTVPRLFGALLSKIFHQDGTLRPDVDTIALSLARQLYYAAKKVRMDCDSRATFKVTREFFDVEVGIRHPSCDWSGDSLHFPDFNRVDLSDPICDQGMRTDQGDLFAPSSDGRETSSDPQWLTLHVVQRLADLVSSDIGDVPYEALRPKHGPGAVSDCRGKSKYSFPNWPRKLELTFPSSEFAVPNANFFHEGIERKVLGLSAHEPPSRLIVVPKTQKAPRLIASEPVAHQWMQQAVRLFLLPKVESGILRGVVRFNDQTYSQKGALAASASGHGCTIDLSSASDRLSCWTVERFFRANLSLLEAFHACRTRWVVNEIDKKLPKYLVLKKFAPMGSALTFVVQSVVYATTSVACTMVERYGTSLYRMSTKKFRLAAQKCARSTIVFGDDIIVPERSYSLVSEVLSYLGLKINTDKSFVGGFFYESCGVDAYAGVDVTPAYYLQDLVESDPSSLSSVVESSNNFHRKGLWKTAEWLSNQIPDRLSRRLGIVGHDDGAFGLASFCGRSFSHLKEKWNDQYQRNEYLMLTVFTREKRKQVEGIYSLFQYFTESPDPSLPWSSGEGSRVRPKYRVSAISLHS